MQQPPLFSPSVLTISELTRYLRQLFESDELLQDVWVQGEVSNLACPSSGHIYLTLKDQSAALRCVIWRSTAERLRLSLQNGMAVEAHGEVRVYEVSGQYQLYIDLLRPVGEGLLYREFLRLKARLEREGLFDPQRKRPPPQLPACIAVVTSASGAALQDMLNTLRSRYPLATVVLAATPVQGDEAPPAIVAALEKLNRQVKPDVIIVARGGGSLEDLWAFNDERVVRAIAASQAPVVTGIGHETDFTLADFAADLRAPTPTAAVVAATPDKGDLQAGLSVLRRDLVALYQGILNGYRRRLDQSRLGLLRASPLRVVQVNRQRLDEVSERARRAMRSRLQLRIAELDGVSRRLAALSPAAVLERGFAIVRDGQGAVVRSVAQALPGLDLCVTVADGNFDAVVKDNVKRPDAGDDTMDV